MYQCIARNGLGMVHVSARLSVADPQANAKTAPPPPIVLPTAPGKLPFDNGRVLLIAIYWFLMYLFSCSDQMRSDAPLSVMSHCVFLIQVLSNRNNHIYR